MNPLLKDQLINNQQSKNTPKKATTRKANSQPRAGQQRDDSMTTENEATKGGDTAQVIEKWLKKLHSALKSSSLAPPKTIKYNEVQVVQVRVIFQKLSDIDTQTGQFDGDIHVMARWQEPQFADVGEEDLEKIPFGHCWNPELTILNLQGQLECERAYYIIKYEPDYAYPVVTFMWHVKGVFKERFELQHFPLDVQELSLVLSTNKPVTEVQLVEDYYRDSYLSPMALKDNEEWAAYSHVTLTRDATSSGALSASSHSVLTASCHARRLLGVYTWNIVLTLVIILVMSLIILAFDPTDVKRIDILMTLFLTTVAFKICIQSILPRLAYVTYLDLYAVFVLVYLAVQGFTNAMWIHLSRYRSKKKIAYYDEVMQSIVIGCLIVFHSAFLIYVQFTALERRRQMQTMDYEHKMGIKKKKKAFEKSNKADHSNSNKEIA